MPTLDPFYPICPSSEWVARLAPLGVRLVQLRLKDMDEEEIRRQVVEARDLCAAHGACLVVNDHWRIAIEEGCEFVHLGQEDADEADLAAIRQAGLRLGVSTHDDAELDRALALDPDYLALGPVYGTATKEMAWQPQGLDKVREWKRRIGDRPLVAIGGMTVERAADVLGAGADALAVVTDVIGHPEPGKRVAEWLEVTRPARRADRASEG